MNNYMHVNVLLLYPDICNSNRVFLFFVCFCCWFFFFGYVFGGQTFVKRETSLVWLFVLKDNKRVF